MFLKKTVIETYHVPGVVRNTKSSSRANDSGLSLLLSSAASNIYFTLIHLITHKIQNNSKGNTV